MSINHFARIGFKADQVQAFYPSPMATATTMYHTKKNPLRKVGKDSDEVTTAKSPKQRRLHKAILRYHDPDNWPMIREALSRLKLSELIGSGPDKLVPVNQPRGRSAHQSPRRKNSKAAHEKRVQRGKVLTQHSGLPPRSQS